MPLRYLPSCSGATRLAAGDLGDLARERQVGGGVLQLAVVLVDEERGRVAADLLAVPGGR